MSVPGVVLPAINCHACTQVVDLTGFSAFAEVACPTCGTHLTVPVEFGSFFILKPIGIGGVGTVYKAMDMILNRYVALKVLKPALAADPEFIDNFAREARAAAAVSHINVAQVYTFAELDGHYFIAMELLEGGSLDEIISRRGRLGEEEVLKLGCQVAAGLRAAYDQHLLHRDVKPGNILFDTENVPKIVDFGLARNREQIVASNKQIWGTPYYIAPEKLRGQTDDIRSDIYSLGATLFHALAGRPPFEAATATDVAIKHTTQPVTSLKVFAPGIQDATARVIGRMLAKNPAERYNNYGELIQDLEKARAGLTITATPTTVTQAGARFPIATVISVVLVLVGVVALAIGGWLYNGKVFGSKPPPKKPATSATLPGAPPAEVEVSFRIEMPWGPYWLRANEAANAGQIDAARKDFATLRDLLRGRSAHLSWADLYEGIILHLGGQHDAARATLNRIGNGATVTDPVTSTNLVVALAAMLRDQLSVTQIEQAKPQLTTWEGAVGSLAIGTKHLVAGDLAKAVPALQGYERAIYANARRWVFLLQPLVCEVQAECEAAQAAITQSEKQSSAAGLQTIRGALGRAKNPLVQKKLRERETALQRTVNP